MGADIALVTQKDSQDDDAPRPGPQDDRRTPAEPPPDSSDFGKTIPQGTAQARGAVEAAEPQMAWPETKPLEDPGAVRPGLEREPQFPDAPAHDLVTYQRATAWDNPPPFTRSPAPSWREIHAHALSALAEPERVEPVLEAAARPPGDVLVASDGGVAVATVADAADALRPGEEVSETGPLTGEAPAEAGSGRLGEVQSDPTDSGTDLEVLGRARALDPTYGAEPNAVIASWPEADAASPEQAWQELPPPSALPPPQLREPLAARVAPPASAPPPIPRPEPTLVAPPAAPAAFTSDGRLEAPPVAMDGLWERYKGYGRTAVRYALYGLGAYFALVFALILLYRFVNPPASMLMLVQGATGTDVQQEWVPLDEISPSLVRAVIVSEDWSFCEHYGIDIKAIEQAIEKSGDGIPRGASTISMQLTKNLFLWNAKSYIRKAIEVPLTLMIELIWPKWRILEVYLNVAEWGPGIFGAEAAAQYHFGKSAVQLGDREAAQLAASLPNPMIRDAGDPGPRTARKANVVQARMRNAGGAAQCVLGPRRAMQ